MGQSESITYSYILNKDAWKGKFPKCEDCFPLKIDATLPCLPQCLFTKEGKGGTPEIVEYIFASKAPPQDKLKPQFIIAYGPSGSGKSRIMEIFPKINLKNVIEVNVDKIFQTNPRFKKQMDEIQAVSNDPLYTQRLYQYYRWIADQVADGVLNEALTQKYHILWETTGNSIGWIEKEIARINSLGYETVIVFPLVSVPTLLTRVTDRAKLDKQVGASEEEIKTQSTNAQHNLVKFLQKHDCPAWILNNINTTLRSCNPTRVIIFTNETNQAELLYDSNDLSNEANKKNLKKYLHQLTANEEFIRFFEEK